MRSKKSRALYEIRDAILMAQDFVFGYDFERFSADRKTFHASTRMLEIISEASRHLDASLRSRHPELPWRSIRDAGNFYRHDYDNVAESYVWAAIVNQLPTLLTVVMAEIERLGEPS